MAYLTDDIILTVTLIDNRIYIDNTGGCIQFGIKDEEITSELLELIDLMPGCTITELIVDDANKFFKLAFKNEGIHKFIEFNFDRLIE